MTPAVGDLIARSNALGADKRTTNYAGGNTSAKGAAVGTWNIKMPRTFGWQNASASAWR